MKKHSGFTLIELMVVMAIIAILATAGLSAYTGYIKKARDTTRIADVNAINTIIQGSLSINGSPPADMTSVVTEANNGQMITDPLGSAAVCLTDATTDTLGACGYTYSLCDDGAGYLISAKLESKSNQAKYTTTGGAPAGYHVGSCTAGATGGTATIEVAGSNWMTSDLPGFYQWNKISPGWTSGWTGTGPGSGDPCTANNPATRMPNIGELTALSSDDITTLGLSKNGFLLFSDGTLLGVNFSGNYWSSSSGDFLVIEEPDDFVFMNIEDIASGHSVRCLQE